MSYVTVTIDLRVREESFWRWSIIYSVTAGQEGPFSTLTLHIVNEVFSSGEITIGRTDEEVLVKQTDI